MKQVAFSVVFYTYYHSPIRDVRLEKPVQFNQVKNINIFKVLKKKPLVSLNPKFQSFDICLYSCKEFVTR